MNLPELIERRRTQYKESLRTMAQRAVEAGEPISHVQLGEYAKGPKPVPSEATCRAIAAALDLSAPEVTLAAVKSVVPLPAAVASPYALAFLRLTEGRTEEEIRQTLGAVEAVLRAMDASRQATLQEIEAADGQDRQGALG